MKRRSTCDLVFTSPIGLTQYKKVLFLFKQHQRETEPALFRLTYPGEGVTADPENQRFVVRLNSAQTALFAENRRCYVDVHPYLTNGDEPAVPIFEIYAGPTLYQAEELEE